MSEPAVNLCDSDAPGDVRACVINVLEFLTYAFDAANIAQDKIYPLTGSGQAGVITVLSACAETLRRIGD